MSHEGIGNLMKTLTCVSRGKPGGMLGCVPVAPAMRKKDFSRCEKRLPDGDLPSARVCLISSVQFDWLVSKRNVHTLKAPSQATADS